MYYLPPAGGVRSARRCITYRQQGMGGVPGGVDVDVAAGGARVDRHVEVERHPALVRGCTV